MPNSEEVNKNLTAEDQLLLNTYIHDYLTKQSYGDTARLFQKEASLPTISEEEAKRKSEALASSENTLGASVASKSKQGPTSQQNGAGSHSLGSPSSPTSKGTVVEVPIDVEGSFLAEWWTIFWDMFAARQGRASSTNAAHFMAHNQRLKAERQNIAIAATQNINNAAQIATPNSQFVPMAGRPNMKLPAGVNPGEVPGPGSDMVLNPNGPMNAKAREALMRQAMMNNGQRKATYPPTQAEIQRLKTQQYLQQQQQAQQAQQQQQQQAQQQQETQQQSQGQSQQQRAVREESEQLAATANHSSPVISAPSPSKRQRLSPDGAYAQVPGVMRPGQHMPNGPQSQQAQQMLMKAGINPAGLTPQQLQAFQAQTPVAQQQQLSAYVHNLATQQQRAMQKAAGNPAAAGQMMSSSPVMQNADAGGPPAEGNHALQDYQMQLMLLEQQNKKRLLMARQEQERMGQPGDGQQVAPFNNNSPQARMPGSPPAGRDLQRGTPKISNQHGPGSPSESVAQHTMQAQMPTQIPRNASPAVNFMPNHAPVTADPQQQQMMYRQAMMQQQQENGGLPIMMGQQGPVMRPQMQFPPNHPAYNNPQLMQQMMQGQDPRARMFQQQMMQQQQQMQQNGHMRGMTPQQQHQHAMAQHAHAQQQAHQAAQQQQQQQQQQQHAQQQHTQQGPPSHQQMPPPAAPAQNVMNRGMSAQQGQPPSPSLSNNQPPTPVQQHAKAPMRKTSAKETKKAANKKKGGQPATPSASEPPTPTTPATPLQAQGQFGNHQQQQQHPVHMSSQISSQHLQGDQAGFGAIEGGETSTGFSMGDFGAAGDLDMNMMQDFDFDSFLQDEPANAAMTFAGFGGDDS